jgi:hypothetical protein
LVFSRSELFCQKADDNTITVTVADTSNLYQRVRQAITFTNLVIRDNNRKDTLITLSERIHGFSIFVIARVVILDSLVEISGAYGLGSEDFWGYPAWPKSYKQIVYFKGSEAWQILRQIAIKLDGKMEFLKRKA